MDYKELSRWDLIILDRKTRTCRIDFVFFYDQKYHFEDVHLLEHLLLHQSSAIPWINKNLIELRSLNPQVNWLTSGIFLSINIHSIPEDMTYLCQILVNFFEDNLIIKPQELKHERKLIDLEEVYKETTYFHKTYYLSVLDYSYMEKLYGPVSLMQGRFPIKEYDLDQIHRDIIRDNRVSIIVRWDAENKDVKDALSFLEYRLSKKKVAKKKYINNSITYYPKIEEFEMDGTERQVGIFFSQTKLWYKQFAYYLFFYHFVVVNLNEFVREVEVSNYWIHHTYRMVPYAWQEFFRFITSLWSDDILDLFQKMIANLIQH